MISSHSSAPLSLNLQTQWYVSPLGLMWPARNSVVNELKWAELAHSIQLVTAEAVFPVMITKPWNCLCAVWPKQRLSLFFWRHLNIFKLHGKFSRLDDLHKYNWCSFLLIKKIQVSFPDCSPGSYWPASWRFHLFSQEGLSDGAEQSRVRQGETGRAGSHLWGDAGAAAADVRGSWAPNPTCSTSVFTSPPVIHMLEMNHQLYTKP